MDVKRRIATNVRRIRSGLSITQAELAARIGVDRAYVSALERGLYNPTVERLEAIATSLEVDIVNLFSVDNDLNSRKP